MTREEQIDRLQNIIDRYEGEDMWQTLTDKRDYECIKVAIEALEQEPCENWYDVPSDEMTLEQARQAVRDLRKMWAEHLEQEPCGKDINVPATDAISRQAVLDGVDRYIYKSQSTGTQDDFYSFAELVVKQLPSVTPQPKTGHCKECKYFEYNSVVKVDGIPLIVAHEICSRWGDGCKTREDGYCFLFEPQESEDKE